MTLEREVQKALVVALDEANLGKQTPWGTAGLVVTLTDLALKEVATRSAAGRPAEHEAASEIRKIAVALVVAAEALEAR